MPTPRLVAFDLDDTLAPSKSAVDPRIARLLVLSPSAWRSRSSRAASSRSSPLRSSTGFRMPRPRSCRGSTCCRPAAPSTTGSPRQGIQTVYAHSLTDDQKARALAAVESEAKRLGVWESRTWGDILEDRGSQITFSALGQAAPLDAKTAWDPTGAKKNALRAAVAARLPDLEVRSGGSTSVDITRHGIDKAYGMRQLAEQTGIPLSDMLFVGDRLDPDGNDYPVLAMGVACHAVTGWEDTAAFLDELIPTLPQR